MKAAVSRTLENAVERAKDAPADIAKQLLEQAQHAYTSAFQVVMTIAAVILFGLMVLVLSKLRDVKLEAEHDE